MVYKVVARDKRTNVQVQKKVYTTDAGFKRYGTEIIQRWGIFYDISVFKQINDKWVSVNEEPQIDLDKDLIISREDVDNIKLDLEDLLEYLDRIVHANCAYDIYSHLIDRIETIQRVFDE